MRRDVLSLRSLLYRWWQACAELLLLLPVYLLGVWVTKTGPIHLWISVSGLALFALVGVIVTRLLAHRLSKVRYLLGALPVLFIAASLPRSDVPFSALTSGAFYLSYCLGVHKAQQDPPLVSVALIWTGLLSYVVVYVLCLQLAIVHVLLPLISNLAILAMAIVLFGVNRNHLQFATSQRENHIPISPALLRLNRLYISLVFGLIVILAGIRAILTALTWLFTELFALINHLLMALLGKPQPQIHHKLPATAKLPAHIPPQQAGPGEWLFRDFIFSIITIAILYGLWQLARRVPRWFRQLLQWLALNTSSGAPRGYSDESERIEAWREWLSPLSDRWRRLRSRFIHEATWQELRTNQARIRWLYRKWLRAAIRNGYTFNPSLTPNEIAVDLSGLENSALTSTFASHPTDPMTELALLYGAVRYGDKDCEDAPVDRLHDWLDDRY